MGVLTKKESHSFSSNTLKKTKRNLNRAVEMKFNVLFSDFEKIWILL